MLSVVKTVVLSAGNAEEIAVSSEHISLLMYSIAGIYICPPQWREVIVGMIYIYPLRAKRVNRILHSSNPRESEHLIGEGY